MTRTPSLRLALLGALAAPLAAQQQTPPPDRPPADKPAADKPLPKLAEWPALKPPEQERVAALVGQFHKPDEALRKSAQEQLIALGEGTVPILFRQVSDRPENVNDQLFLVLDRLLGPQHAALMARETRGNRLELRRYLVRRLCRFVDPEMKPVLQAATKDKDAEVTFCAHLGLLALREQTSLQPVLERCRTEWADRRELVAAVLPAGRSEPLGTAVAELIAKSPPPVQATGLRLFRYLGTKQQAGIARSYLVAEDHGVKREAVNAMRALNGEEPIENLSVFQTIEMAKEWLKK